MATLSVRGAQVQKRAIGLALAAIASLIVMNQGANAQDVTAGATVFKKCSTCHAIEDGTNKIGPSLYNVIGSTAGAKPGYQYSQAMKNAGAGGLVWDKTAFMAFVTSPKDNIKGNKMAFQGLTNEEDKENLFAYLQSIGKQP